MDDLQERYQFEDFPRETLNKGITRRQLLTTLAAELHLLSKRNEGLAGIKLSNLGVLSDEDLKDYIPAIVKGTQISIKDNAVWALTKGAEKPVYLFHIDPVATFTFNLINGQNTIGAIVERLQENSSIPADRAFSIVRGMFLSFVKSGICLPVNNPSAG